MRVRVAALLAVGLAMIPSIIYAQLSYQSLDLIDYEVVEQKVTIAVCLEQRNAFQIEGIPLSLPGFDDMQILVSDTGAICLCLSSFDDIIDARNLMFALRPSFDVVTVYNGPRDGPDLLIENNLTESGFELICSPHVYAGFFL